MRIHPKKIHAFQKVIFSWWTNNRRDLPWRRTHDPYKILVSEVMLQQTQVTRVLPKYKEFLDSFPDATSLAQADTASVLRAWKGMGYNRRALYLKRAAQEITTYHKGKFPKSQKELIKLPGLGIYTARAIMVFAYKQNVAMVDTNIRQIITHFFFKDKPQKESVIQEVADQLFPTGKSWEWHQALMDYGSLAMPRGKKPLPNKKKTVPFSESNRFYRGKIIDRLRVGNVKKETLIRDLAKTYKKTHGELKKIIEGLQKEGLLVVTPQENVRLPK